jgi:cytochrome c oxidase cbb3-type subunit 3
MTPDDPSAATPHSTPGAPEEPLFEHSYDGIQEYDNPMPRWWVLSFWATIVWAAIYAANVVPIVGFGKGWHANYADEMAAAEKKYAASRAAKPAPADDVLLALAGDPAALESGKVIYMKNCMPCHRVDAGGIIGPNLTDDYWIHGGKPGDIHRVITAGVLDKGMPAWGVVLKPEEVDQVSAYAISVHGTNPENPKEPQGVKADDEIEAGDHAHAEHDSSAGEGTP